MFNHQLAIRIFLGLISSQFAVEVSNEMNINLSFKMDSKCTLFFEV
jgi:hypothetical protein